ncbi:S8 family serine peptidase [Streptomyces sp. NPDC056601]|uniref:S8 family serine peptidase n=1 Tax=Streptomyces sp. NPDC056601 TaxID=3345875 RepID=UPI0036C4CDDF
MTQVPCPRRVFAASVVTALATLAVPAPSASAVPSPAGGTDARSVLSSLDHQELQALHRMATLDVGGLRVTDKAALRSAKPVDVIVQLSTPPARTARLLAAARGGSLSDADAKAAVTKSHAKFRSALEDMFPAAKDKDRHTARTTNAVRLHRSYTHSFDGVSLSVPGNRVADLLKQDGVTAVWPDTEVKAFADHKAVSAVADSDQQTSTDDTDADAVARLHGEGITGKGVKIGVIDTGIDYHHPDLKGVYAGGYDFVDDDDPMETTYADWKASGQAETNQGSVYYTEHGTHVAGIIAGRGDTGKERAAHGVAPDARVYAYRALGPYGRGTTGDILAAMDKAADDGMDVVNMSLGASINDPLSPQSLAADNLVLAGVTTVIAAGNSGPGTGTLGTPGAAALPLTVGARDAPLTLPSYTLSVGSTKAEGRLLATPYGDALDELATGDHAVTDVGTGTAAGYTGKDVTGQAVLIKRGGITLDEKVKRAQSKGATAVLLANDNAEEGHIPVYLGESPNYVPTFSLTATDGAALAAADGRVSFTPAGTFRLGDGSLADFSSRGPVYGTAAIKPEVTAPGVSVLSSVPADIVDPAGRDYTYAYARLSGTSMATPYVAGTAALMLQHDPKLTPDGVKTAMMNTATALPGDVSVFEEGAGAVDPYVAVHTLTTVDVPSTTPYVSLDGTESELPQNTGALDFGVQPLGRKARVTRTLRVVNDSGKPITYEVKTTFTRGSGSSGDAPAAHVTLSAGDKISVGAHGKRSLRAALAVPSSAPAGYYEGHLTLTPVSGTGVAAVRVPFGLRVAKSGFDTIDITKSVLSTGRATAEGAVGGGTASFNLKMAGQLRSIDIFLADAHGKDIGYVGGLNTTGLTEGVLYGPATVGAWYFPFTGEKGTPIDPRGRWMTDGHYKLRIVGTDAQGGADTELRDVYVDNHVPDYSDSYGRWDPSHPTIVERDPDTTSLPLKGTLRDGQTDAVRAAGIDIGQDDNVLYYGLYSLNAPTGQTCPDATGKVDSAVPIGATAPTAAVKLWPTDAAGNIGDVRLINVVKRGTPYWQGDADASSARAGDRVTYTLTAHELKNWKSFSTQIRYNDGNVKIVDVRPTAELAARAPSAIRRTDVVAGTSSYSSFSFDVGDADGLSGDSMPLLKVTYEVTGGAYTTSAGLNTGTTSATDTAGDKTVLNIQFFGAVQMLNGTSTFNARPAAQALLTETSSYDAKRDYGADGFKATLTAPDGTSRNLTADTAARMSASGLEPTVKPYRFQVAVPGHFTWTEDVDMALHGDWGVAGTFASSKATLVAGDVNGDDVIDVRDAAAVLKARGTADRAADIDHDGTVDAADMNWVVQNYLMQNSMADHNTDPVERLQGRTLEDYVNRM